MCARGWMLHEEPRLENNNESATRVRRHSVGTMATPAPIDIIFIIRGQRLAGVEDIQDPVDRVLCRAIAYRVRRTLGRLVCPTHGQRPRVIASGPSADELTFSVDGCCQFLIDTTLVKIF
jgi:hypothetical protein